MDHRYTLLRQNLTKRPQRWLAVAAGERWPPNVEDHLRKSCDQTPLGEAVRKKTRHLTLS